MKRLLAGIVLLAVAAGAMYGYTFVRRDALYRTYISQGDAALAQENTSAAVEAFSASIGVKPEAMLGYLRRGETYRKRGEYDPALRDLRRASDLDPTATRPLEALGDVNLALKRYARAVERYRDYIRIDDRSAPVLYKLAFARYNDGHAAEAIEPLQRAIAIDDRFAEAYYLLGLCQRDAQKPELARRALEQSIVLQPGMLHAREELADLYGTLGRTESRIAQLKALAALDSRPVRDIALGTAYADAGQVDAAIVTLGNAAERHPDAPGAYVALGRVWLEIAQSRNDRVALSKALGALGGAVGSDESSEGLTLFGRALLLARDVESAERMLQDATERRPVDASAFYYLADAEERLGHYTAARQALLNYVTLRGDAGDPRRAAAEFVRLAELSLKAHDPAAAADYVTRSLASDPTNARALALRSLGVLKLKS